MARIGPIIFEAVGDEYLSSARILGITWEGATSAGDQIEIRDPDTRAILWVARTPDTNTYLGINMGPNGIHAPNGFRAALLDSGRVSIYLRED